MEKKLNPLMPQSEGPVLCFEVSDPVTSADYDIFLDLVRKTIAEHGEFRLLLNYVDFQGWEAEAAAKDLEFYVELGRYMQKFCLVAPPEKELMSKIICRQMIAGELKVFGKGRLDDAVAWIKSD